MSNAPTGTTPHPTPAASALSRERERALRVLMTADTVGGVWTYAVELTRVLPDVDFVLATMGRKASAAQKDELPRNVRLIESEYKLEWQDAPWDDVARAADWLLDLEALESPDLIHLNGYTHGAAGFKAPRLVVGHSCVLSWWRAVKNEDASGEWMTYRENVERGLAGATLVAAPSAWMLGALHDLYRFRGPSRLIYNGRRFAPQTLAKQPTVFAAGRMWDEAKNLRAVVDAAPLINAPVKVAGDGSDEARNVTHLGRLDFDAMQRAYAEASVYLFPALYEPFGLSILEAAIAGCALVIGDIPSLREIWDDAAVFVPPRDAEAIARTVNELLNNDAFRDELSRRAQRRAAQFTPERMAEGYRAAYASLANAEVRA